MLTTSHGWGISARAHVHTALLYLRNGLTDCVQIWYVGWASLSTGAFSCYGTVNRGYFERFLHSTLNIFFINCSTDINPTPYLGLNMGPSSFTLKKKLAPLKFLIFKIVCCVQSCPTMGLL